MKVLLTGASGLVGTDLRPFLSNTYDEILLTSRSRILDLRPNERYEQGDITDADFVDSLLKQVDGAIHLAGMVGPNYSFEEVMAPNVTGTYNLFHAAHRYGVKHIVNASSHHALGFHRRGTQLDNLTTPRADSYYGISKAFGEILASYFADKFGLNILTIRIGYVGEKAIDERRMRTWCSPRDLAQLVHIGLSTPDLGNRLVYGVSNNPGSFFDNSSAEEIGYKPMDNSLDFLADPKLRDAVPNPNLAEDMFIGGYFASGGMDKDVLAHLLAKNKEETK